MPYIYVKGRKKAPKFKPVPLERGPRALGQLKYNLQRSRKRKNPRRSLARNFLGF